MEVRVLVNAYADVHTVVDGRSTPTITHTDKTEAWEQVAQSINCQSVVGRTVEEYKKKLSDLNTLVKNERERMRRQMETGGGPAPLRDWEEQLLMCPPQVTVVGFGGIDSFTDHQVITPKVTPRTVPTRALTYDEDQIFCGCNQFQENKEKQHYYTSRRKAAN